LGYTIEEILDHDVDWINAVLKEIERQDLDDTTFRMALHGVSKENIDKFRNECEGKSKSDSDKLKDIRIPPQKFRQLGLGIGKKTHTIIKR